MTDTPWTFPLIIPPTTQTKAGQSAEPTPFTDSDALMDSLLIAISSQHKGPFDAGFPGGPHTYKYF